MKIRDLVRQIGSVTVPAWPPRLWTPEPYTRWTVLPTPDDGVLRAVMHPENDVLLRLTMRFAAENYIGLLVWDGSPTPSVLEQLLSANVGRAIRAIGDLEIETGTAGGP